MERRQLLKRAGLVGGATIGDGGVGAHVFGRDWSGEEPSGAGTAQARTPRSGPVRNADAFDNVVHAAEAGADPRGTDPINDFLEQYAGDGTLLAFSLGTYRLEPIDLSGYADLALSAAYDERPTFVPTEGYCVEGGSSYLQFDGVRDFLLENVEFDFGAALAGGVVRVIADGDATARDVAIAGCCATQVAQFRIDVRSSDATAIVERLALTNHNDPSLTGAYVGEDHAGTVRFRDCTVEGFSDNGLYASAPGLDSGEGGTVHVEGGTYRNNNIANVRLGSDGSTFRGVESVSTELPTNNSTGPTVNVRGILLRNGRDLIVEDCSVYVVQTAGFSHGGLVVHKENAGTTVTNTTIEVDRDGTPTIRTFPGVETDGDSLRFENVEVVGDAGFDRAVHVAGRNGTVFRNCTIEQQGTDRRGIVLQNSRNSRIVDSRIDAATEPLRPDNATATVVDTTLATPEGTRHVDRLEATGGTFTVGGGE